jgi:glycosyltransferase involved in cell wall biosynthesis
VRLAFVYPPLIVQRRDVDFTNLWDSVRGTTGSELMVLGLARAMAARGHDVGLYIERPNASRWDGVRLHDLSLLSTNSSNCDAVVSLADTDLLRNAAPSAARIVLQQLNDFSYASKDFADHVDIFVSPSEPHRVRIEGLYPATENRWRVVPNGCDPSEYDTTRKVAGRCVYTSSPDRGLHLVLQEWPHIRKAVPGAELRIFYFALERFLAEWREREEKESWPFDMKELCRRSQYIDHAVGRLAGHGVRVMGAASRRQLASELSEAEVLAFPCDTLTWSEGFSCATMEGCAAGALPVISAEDAFGDIYGGACPMVPSKAHQHAKEWRELVIRALTDESWAAEHRRLARELAEQHSWERIAARFEPVVDEARDLASSRAKTSAAKQVSTRLPIDLYLTSYAASGQPIDPDDITAHWTAGGSRAGFLGLAKALAARTDCDVRAFSTFTRKATIDGLQCIPIGTRGIKPREIAFAYYDTSILQSMPAGVLRIASHHTYTPPTCPWEYVDVHTAPSAHALERLRSQFLNAGTWRLLPNGVADEGATWRPVRGRVVHHTSPDRGLHLLLDAWPKIIEAVPFATLHVVGRAKEYASASMRGLPAGSVRWKRGLALMDAVAKVESLPSVKFTGPLPRSELLRELSEASCFAFPASVLCATETFSLSVMESLRIGVPVVLSPVDALSEVYGQADSGVTLCPRGSDGEPDMAVFAERVIERLLDTRPHWVQAMQSQKARAFASKFSFESQAQSLVDIIGEQRLHGLIDSVGRRDVWATA